MKIKLLNILACPKCKANLIHQTIKANQDGTEIIEGSLHCEKCSKNYSITNGIARFVEPDNYASSFGYQWNLFRKEQIDSHNGTDLSAKRFWSETGWTENELKGKWVLDAGCGAGRFLDAAANSQAEIIGIDISSAVDAAKANLEGKENVHFIQASIYELPFKEGTFDFCYCLGVIQHTPDPESSIRSLAEKVKEGGKIAVTIYERRKWWTMFFSKYWLRPVTKRMPNETLLKMIKGLMPIAFPITDVLFRIPVLGKFFMFAIPIANYVHERQLNRQQRYAWAILDTFDMLSPQFDSPMTEEAASKVLIESGIEEISRLPNSGLNLVGRRTEKI